MLKVKKHRKNVAFNVDIFKRHSRMIQCVTFLLSYARIKIVFKKLLPRRGLNVKRSGGERTNGWNLIRIRKTGTR